MGLLLFYALISIIFSFLCSIWEAVLLSITSTYINLKKKENKHFAFIFERLKKDIDKPLIAILTLNTIAHTVGAILVGVQAKVTYAENYGNVTRSFLGLEFTEELMVGSVSAVMTMLILVASEIIPKTLGATYWRQLANFTAKSLHLLVLILKWTGLLWLLQLFTRLISKGAVHGSVLSREDFTVMTDIAEEEGVFHASESTVIKNLLRFNEVKVKDVMTPRAVMKIASEAKSIKEFHDENPNLRFSRIPLFGERVDIVTGYVLKDQVLEEIINKNGDNPLSSLRRDLLVTKRATSIPQLFATFVEQREHIALVVDEYGSLSGIVTMEDIIETLLGLEIMDESDNVEDLQVLARKKWEARAKRTGIIE